MAKKITKTTLKSFIRNNADSLYVLRTYFFDGMTDGIEGTGNTQFQKVEGYDLSVEFNYDIKGLWLVGNSRDLFTAYNDGTFEGIKIHNSCGTYVIAKRITQ